MSSTLFIFLFSDRVDSYINVIAYAYDNLQVRNIQFVHVKGADTALSDAEANLVSDRIWIQIESLAIGEYINFPRKGTGNPNDKPITTKLSQPNRIDIYRRIRDDPLKRGLEPVDYANLKDELKSVFRKHAGTSHKNYIIDLTAGTKMPTIDIFTTCIALGINNLYIFELVDSPNPKDPEASLYHALEPKKYNYKCITKSPPVVAGQAAFLLKGQLRPAVILAALIVLAVSLLLLVTQGQENGWLQFLAVLSALISIATPLIDFFRERRPIQ